MIIGIIGFGSIGSRHYENIRQLYPKAKINILTKRNDLPEQGHTFLWPSEQNFFNQKNDIFFITNETHKHAETILKCLQRNPKGIFVEKPLSNSLANIAKIEKIISEKKLVFFVGYCLQFYKPLLILKNKLKQIGTPLFIRASVGQDLRTWRKGDYKKNYSYDSQKGGGVILDLIHELNYPAWLLGENLSFVAGINSRLKAFDIKSENIAEGAFRSEKGTLVSVHQDYLQNPGRRYCEIVGTKGTLWWDGQTQTIRFTNAKKVDEQKITMKRNTMFQDELKFFMRKVNENKGFNNLNEAANDLKNALALKKHAN